MKPVKIKITDFLEFLKNNKLGKNNFSDFIASDSISSSITDTDYNEAESIILYDTDPKSYIRYDFNLYIQENQQFPNLTRLIFDPSLLMSNICINTNRAIDLDILCNVEDTNIDLVFNKIFNDSSSGSKNEVILVFKNDRTYVNNLTLNNMLEDETLNVYLPKLTSNKILIKETLDLRNITLSGGGKLVPLKDIYMKNLINGKNGISAGNLAYSNYVENLKPTYTLIGNEVTGEQEGMKVISHSANLVNFEELNDSLSKPLFENNLNNHNRFSSFIHFFLPIRGYDNMSIEVVQPKDIKKSKLIFKSMFLTAKTGYTLILEEDAIFEVTRIFKKVTIENPSSHLALVDKDNEFWSGDRLLLKAGTVLSLLPSSNFSTGSSYLETKNFINN